MGAHTHERQEFESGDKKWQQAAQALIERAKVQSKRAGRIISIDLWEQTPRLQANLLRCKNGLSVLG